MECGVVLSTVVFCLVYAYIRKLLETKGRLEDCVDGCGALLSAVVFFPVYIYVYV